MANNEIFYKNQFISQMTSYSFEIFLKLQYYIVLLIGAKKKKNCKILYLTPTQQKSSLKF